MSTCYKNVDRQINFVKTRLLEKPGMAVAMPTYTQEEFAALFPEEKYAEFTRRQRQFIFALCVVGIPAQFVTFVEATNAGYTRYLNENNKTKSETSMMEYAEHLLNCSKK